MWIRWIPTVLYMVFLFYLSGRPARELPALPVPDYVLHAGAYIVLGLLAGWAVIRPGAVSAVSAGRQAAVVIVVGAAYGLFDEIHQRWVPGRVPSAADWAADVAGAGIAALVWAWRARRRRAEDAQRRARIRRNMS